MCTQTGKVNAGIKVVIAFILAPLQLFPERLSYRSIEEYTTVAKGVMGGATSPLLDQSPQCFSAIEGRCNNMYIHGFSFLCMKHLQLRSINNKEPLPKIPFGIVRYAFGLLQGNLSGDSCILVRMNLHPH